MAVSQPKQSDRRNYIRLNAVFPVEFQFIDPETSGSISDVKQGFTRNIGKGGICLEANDLRDDLEQFLKDPGARLDVRMHIPLSRMETKAVAKIAWHQKVGATYPNKYLIGLSFVDIDPKDRNRIYLHARKTVFAPVFFGALFLVIAAGLLYFSASDLKLRVDNKKLVQELARLSDKKASLEKKLKQFDRENKEIEAAISDNKSEIDQYKAKLTDLDRLNSEFMAKDSLIAYLRENGFEAKSKIKQSLLEKARFNARITRLSRENEYLKNRVSRISFDKVSVEDNLRALLASFRKVEDKSVVSMYKWIKNHQNRRTGLVISYEGDKDLEDWAFTYDQSLAIQCFTLMGDQSNAKAALDFYRDGAQKVDDGFVNAYDAYTGKPSEYIVHAGPNIWLGIAILQYTAKFKDETYLAMAEDIAKWLIYLQRQDREYGIKGGPRYAWFSTEHNLDAYAFFGMLYKITEEAKYLDARKKTLAWIKKNAFNKKEGRMNRGKGDATIATDTFAWAIAAIGPKVLKDEGMDPDQIIDFAETNCLVATDYSRPDSENVKVTGFDFGKYEHVARGGVVSTEWTGQMAVTFRIMADYYRARKEFDRAEYYGKKADFYISELEKMVIISPSRIGQGQGCLPYATQDDVDTGHGWRVPRGARTGSTAGTAYTIFAKYNYNPLTLD
ncbi:MAG: PilZ domain-containing protein [Candidatus Omnitrophota bacterium]